MNSRPVELSDAAAQLGLAASTLRVQIRNGRLRARKHGRDWFVTQLEIDRYRREHLGRGSRRAGPTRPTPVSSVELDDAFAASVQSTDAYVAAFSDRLRYHGGINDGVTHAHNVCELLDLLDRSLDELDRRAAR